MRKEYQTLFTPIKIGKVEIRNRFAMAPMTLSQVNENGSYAQQDIDYFIERAKGGTGLIVTGANFVENNIEKHMSGVFPCATVNPAAYMRSIRKIADGVHAYDSRLFVQLSAGLGRNAIPDIILDGTYVAPSETTNRWDPFITHRALEAAEVREIINQFATSALLVKMAGADGIEVHAVHEGYLLDAFTIEYFNHRMDEFGGDLSGRLRFPIAIVKEIKDILGSNFPVTLRFSLKSFMREERHGILPGEDFPEKGRDIKEGLEIAKILTEAGYDALNIDAGCYDAWYWSHPPFFFKRGLNLEFAKQIKRVVNVPILTAGRLGYPEIAAEAVNSGNTDMVVLGRPLLADPEFVNKMRFGKESDIRPCLCCHDGCFQRGHQLRVQSCAINPQCNREKEAMLSEAKEKKQFLVIGGGPVGMEAARVLAMRGHQVKLFEKESQLGGVYRAACVPDFKDDGKLLIAWYERQLKKVGVKVTLNRPIQARDPELSEADIVINATGSTAIILPIPGIERCILAVDAFCRPANLQQDVAIIGGGQVGCELAIWLAQQGRKVRIVEKTDKLMPLNPPADMNKQMIEELLEHHRVEILLASELKEVKTDSIVLETPQGVQNIPAKQVILAVGFRPNNSLYHSIATQVREIYNVGDSKNPANLMEGIWDAYNLCSKL